MRFVLRAAAVTLMVAMAAACGTGGGDTNNASNDPPKTSDQQPNKPADPKPADSGEPAEPDETDSNGGGDGSAYCDKMLELGEQKDPLGVLAGAMQGGDSQEASIKAIKELHNIYVELSDVAPGEIKTELTSARDLFGQLVETLESGATSNPELEAQAGALGEWGVTIQEYTSEHCA